MVILLPDWMFYILILLFVGSILISMLNATLYRRDAKQLYQNVCELIEVETKQPERIQCKRFEMDTNEVY